MDLSRQPLAELRRRIGEASSDAAAHRLLVALRADPRRGAHALAESTECRLRARRAERRRMARLFALRRRLMASGARAVAGVDEVGVGPLAGPVVACAVVLPTRVELPGLDDSKRVARAARERLARQIREQALAIGIGAVAPAEIDRINVLQASLEAMQRAVAALGIAPDHLLVDARTIPNLGVPQTALVHGDARDGSIAAASIVAKVHRDAIMAGLDDEHPGYGFRRNQGYPTAEHLAVLRRIGPSPVHRLSFGPVARWC